MDLDFYTRYEDESRYINDVLEISDELSMLMTQIETCLFTQKGNVIGQNDFTSGEANRGARVSSAVSLNQPRSLTISEATLFVSDSKNNRVLIYERSGEEMSFSEADGVIGQPGFKTSNINGPKAIPGASTLFLPEAVFVKDGVVLVADSLNNRVLIY